MQDITIHKFYHYLKNKLISSNIEYNFNWQVQYINNKKNDSSSRLIQLCYPDKSKGDSFKIKHIKDCLNQFLNLNNILKDKLCKYMFIENMSNNYSCINHI